MSAAMMSALVEFQKSLYRTHSLITAGERTARITKEERELLDFRVKVEGGSSKLGIDLTAIAQSWGVAAVGRMTPEQIMIMILGTVAVVGATAAWAMYLKNKTEIRKAELESKGQELYFDAFSKLSEQDTKRQEIWAQAMKRVPLLEPIREEATHAKSEILKAVAIEGGGRINGVTIEEDVALDLVANTRRKPAEETMRGVFRVARVDTTVPDGFRVALQDVKTNEEVNASLMDAIISDKHRALIREAEWDKKPISVEMNIRRSRGKIIEAVIVDVS